MFACAGHGLARFRPSVLGVLDLLVASGSL
jgi:hypothetical protein